MFRLSPVRVEQWGVVVDIKAYIGEDKAKAAALAHAGLSEADVSWMKTEFDFLIVL